MAAPPPPAKTPDCSDNLSDQSKWSHKEKEKLAKEAKQQQDHRKPEDYQKFFDTAVEPLNQMARTLQLGDVFFLLALSASESGWLNVENAWLNNLFGLTAGGHDNLGSIPSSKRRITGHADMAPTSRGLKTGTISSKGSKMPDIIRSTRTIIQRRDGMN